MEPTERTEVDADVDAAGREVLAAADLLFEAVAANDIARAAELMTEDWVLVSSGGLMPRAHFLAALGSAHLVHSSAETVGRPRVRTSGDAAVVTTRTVTSACTGDEAVENDEWSTDVYIRRHGRWLNVATHVSPVHTAT